jgi:hypothetical protein
LRGTEGTFIRNYRRAKVRRALKLLLLVGVGTAWLLSRFFATFLTLEQTLLLALVVVIVSLEILETMIYEVDNKLTRPIRMFEDNYAAERDIDSIISEGEPERAYVVAYSGSTQPSKSTVGDLIRENTSVRLLVRHPNQAVNPDEAGLIVGTLKMLYEFNRAYDDIEVQFYDAQASVKATKIDKFLLVGWYTFADRGDREVYGHKNPAIRLTSEGGDDYTELNRWYMDLYYSLWIGGTTPLELYQSENCPDDLQGWVDRAHSEGERENRAEWLRRISNVDYDDKSELFPEHRG